MACMFPSVGDLHVAGVATFVLVCYKQCIKSLESSANFSPSELDLVYHKCNEATLCSRRIHSLIQTRCDEARTKQCKMTPVVSPTPPSSSSAQTSTLSHPLTTRSVSAAKLLCRACILTFCQMTILLILQSKSRVSSHKYL